MRALLSWSEGLDELVREDPLKGTSFASMEWLRFSPTQPDLRPPHSPHRSSICLCRSLANAVSTGNLWFGHGQTSWKDTIHFTYFGELIISCVVVLLMGRIPLAHAHQLRKLKFRFTWIQLSNFQKTQCHRLRGTSRPEMCQRLQVLTWALSVD